METGVISDHLFYVYYITTSNIKMRCTIRGQQNLPWSLDICIVTYFVISKCIVLVYNRGGRGSFPKGVYR